MTRRFGIYAKVTPKQPRLSIRAGGLTYYARTAGEIYDAFYMLSENTASDEWLRALPYLLGIRRRRQFKRPHVPAPPGKLVARLVRNRKRGAKAKVAQ